MQKINPGELPTKTFDWGIIKWLVSPASIETTGLTFGEVIVFPGKGHERHNHPESEEILYVLSGEGVQMLNDAEPFPIKAGDTIYVPTAMFHSTMNTGWEPLVLLALYNPAGAEKILETMPDYKEIAAGHLPGFTRQ